MSPKPHSQRELELPEDEYAIRRKIAAEAQLLAMLELLESRYNLQPDEIPEILDNLRWLAKHRSNLNRLSWTALLGIITLAATGAASAFVEGVKHYFKGP